MTYKIFNSNIRPRRIIARCAGLSNTYSVVGGGSDARCCVVHSVRFELTHPKELIYSQPRLTVYAANAYWSGWKDSNLHAVAGDFKSPVSAISPQPDW
jgi:hypothetical protein